jgi:hypothetical protein
MRFVLIALGSIAALGVQLSFPIALAADDDCDPAYPGVCIPPPPPDLDCRDIEYRNFTVLDPIPTISMGMRMGLGVKVDKLLRNGLAAFFACHAQLRSIYQYRWRMDILH